MEHYLKALKQYATFSGRAGKKEFWFFVLINFAISIILQVLMGATSLKLFGIIAGVWSLATFLPTIAVWVRRMNDIGKEWWYILIPLYNLYLAFQPGQTGENEHGPEPVE